MFRCNIPILPFNVDIELRSFPAWVIMGEKAFMSNYLFKFPYYILLSSMLFLEMSLFFTEHLNLRMLTEFYLEIFNDFSDPWLVMLPMLTIHKKRCSKKFRGVNDWHRQPSPSESSWHNLIVRCKSSAELASLLAGNIPASLSAWRLGVAGISAGCTLECQIILRVSHVNTSD